MAFRHCFFISFFFNKSFIFKFSSSPIFDICLARHLRLTFPNLEYFYFAALDKSAYNYEPYKDDDLYDNFLDQLHLFFQSIPSLRVIKLADKFAKPDLTRIVVAFQERAKANPDKQYLFAFDGDHRWNREYFEAVLRNSATQVTNLRVFNDVVVRMR